MNFCPGGTFLGRAGGGGGAIVFQAGYHPHKRTYKTDPKHVFFRFEKRPKIHIFACSFLNFFVMSFVCGCVFGHIDKFWKGHDEKIKKTTCKNAYLGSIFILARGCSGDLHYDRPRNLPSNPPELLCICIVRVYTGSYVDSQNSLFCLLTCNNDHKSLYMPILWYVIISPNSI